MRRMYPTSEEALNLRAQLVGLWFLGMSLQMISHSTGLSISTAYRWIKRWQQEGHLHSRTRAKRRSLGTSPAGGQHQRPNPDICNGCLRRVVSKYDYLRRFERQNTGPSDLIEEASGAMRAVFMESALRDYFLYIVTDGSTTQAANTSKLAGGIGTYMGKASFEVPPSHWDGSALPSYIHRLSSETNNPCIVLASNERDFFSDVLGSLYERNLLVWSTRVLIITRLPMKDLQPVADILSKVNGMVVLVPTQGGHQKKYRIYVYIPYSQRALEIAMWSQDTGLSYKTEYRMFPNKFDRLIDGGHLKTTAEIYAPHIMLKRKSRTGDKHPHNPFYGPVVELFNILISRMNFTYTVTRPPDGAWGYRYPNGTWNGMVGMLKRKEVDLAFVPFSVLYTRAQVLDYTATLMIDYGRILARKGKTEINPWGFLMPLTPGVWLCLLSSLGLVMAVSFTISSFMQKYEWPSEFSLRNYVRIFLIQDLEDKSVKDVARSILAAAWMIALVVVMESYAGNLRSLLIVRYVPQPYHRVRAVLDDPRITVLWMSGGSYQQILYSIETGDFKELANAEQRKISYLEFTNFEDKVITKVSRGDHVMMWEGLALEIILTRHYSETGTCLFYLSKERFFPLMSAMGTQKFSPLIPALNKRIMRVTESGLYYQWIKGEMKNFTFCANAPTTILVQSSLSLNNLWKETHDEADVPDQRRDFEPESTPGWAVVPGDVPPDDIVPNRTEHLDGLPLDQEVAARGPPPQSHQSQEEVLGNFPSRRTASEAYPGYM
ncbi:glutamate receptor-like [Macrobrachium nipponense]|uniref:glutamate receptor-like n=1 Tax=Macrobrachium nipponense TaxID=159736 RepID=UPI0030C81791